MTVQALHAALLAADSATAVLERICQAPVLIRRLSQPSPEPPLALPAAEAHCHRTVELICAGRVLSRADLWFRPDSLPPAMVRALATTDTPFGRVVQGLGLKRRTLNARICAPGEPASLEHRAVLETAAGDAVAEVFERYTWALVSGG